jgi:hypothetical protein
LLLVRLFVLIALNIFLWDANHFSLSTDWKKEATR